MAGLIFVYIFPFFLCTFGFIGNFLVLISILVERRLQNTTNYFLFSLALADLLVCMVVMPSALLSGFKWTFVSCLIYLYTDVFLCSASICHMAVISLDRYLGISQPLKRHRNRKKRTVTLKIIFVWVLTTLISSPLAIISFIDDINILEDNICAIRSRSFMLYGSTFSFLIPVIIITVTTSKTTKLLKKQARMLSNKKGINELRRTVMPARKKFGRMDSHNLSTGSRSSQSELFARLEKNNSTASATGSHSQDTKTARKGGGAVGGGDGFEDARASLSKTSCPHSEPQIHRPMMTPVEKRRRSSLVDEIFLDSSKQSELKSPPPEIKIFAPRYKSQDNKIVKGHNEKDKNILEDQIDETDATGKMLERPFVMIHRLFLTNVVKRSGDKLFERMPMPNMRYANNEGRITNRKHQMTGSKKAQLASEQKATRVLIVQIVCFFCCWTPFFFQNIILGVCGLEKCGHLFPSWFSVSAVWFGYFSSVLNPIIYTIFNRRFRDTFIRIIQCHYRSYRGDSISTKFWPTLTEAQGLNTTLNSLCQKFSRKPASITANKSTVRRSSYAGEIGIWQDQQESIVATKSSTGRRSTLMLPMKFPMESFVTRRLSAGEDSTFLEKRHNSQALKTIFDSDEGENSFESKSEETSRRPSRSTLLEDVSQTAKTYFHNLMRKVSWQRIGHSASNIFHHDHHAQQNETIGKCHRKITPHILFPIDIQQEIIASSCDRPINIELKGNNNFCLNEMEEGQQDLYSLNSCSTITISTAEEFLYHKIAEIRSKQTTL